MTENDFWLHFSPFQINMILFGWPKITFDRISRHFRSIRNFHFLIFVLTNWTPAAILDDWQSLLIAFLIISGQYMYVTFICFNYFHKMASGEHFGWLKITFDRISRHFRFYFFGNFVTKWPSVTCDFRRGGGGGTGVPWYLIFDFLGGVISDIWFSLGIWYLIC